MQERLPMRLSSSRWYLDEQRAVLGDVAAVVHRKVVVEGRQRRHDVQRVHDPLLPAH